MKSARQECFIFAVLVPLLTSDLKLPWASQVVCTDAYPEGFGICEAELSLERVKATGRRQERWRYKRSSPDSWKPQERAGALDFLKDFSTVSGGSVQENASYEFDGEFPEVPHDVLVPGRWSLGILGKWKHKHEHIILKGGRVHILALGRLTRTQGNCHKRHLVLMDSIVLCSAIATGRARSFSLLRICQQSTALALCADLLVRPRWIPSEVNVSDCPSRGQVEPGVYKSGASATCCDRSSVQYSGAGPEAGSWI